ncbi:MAG: TolC family protein [Rikenellaceae bacterium]
MKRIIINLLFCCSALYAEVPYRSVAVIETLESELHRLDSLLFSSTAFGDYTYSPTFIEQKYSNQLDSLEQSFSESLDRWSRSVKQSHRQRSGLSLNIGYDRMLNDSSVGTIDDDYYSYYNKLGATLSWDIIESPLIGRQPLYERADLMSREQQLTYDHNQRIESAELFTLRCKQLFDSYNNYIVEAKIALYNAIYQYYKYIFSEGKVTNIEIASARLNISLARRLLRGSTLATDRLFDIDRYIEEQHYIPTTSIDSVVRAYPTMERAEVEQEIIKTQRRSNSYWSQTTIAPYVRSTYYGGRPIGDDNRLNTSVGINVSLPILSGAKATRNQLSAQIELMQRRAKVDSEGMQANIETLIANLNNNYLILISTSQSLTNHRQECLYANEMYRSNNLSIDGVCQTYLDHLDYYLQMCEYIHQRELLRNELLMYGIR